MKIEVKERDVDGYDELLSISVMSKKIYNNPKSKVMKLSTRYFLWIFYLLLIIVFFVSLIFVPECKDMAYVGVIVMLVFEIRMLHNYFSYKKILKVHSEQKGFAVIEFTNEKICSKSDSGNESVVTWDSIKYVIINKYSITFFQNNSTTGPVVGLSSKCVDDLLSILEKCNKMNLLVDNRELYK